MNKYEFIRELNAHLKGKVSEQEFADTISYYEDYIDSQIRMGKREEEVIAALGSPRLLAKSIITANNVDENFTGRSEANHYGDYGSDTETTYTTNKFYINGHAVPIWLVLAIVLFVVVLVLVLVFKALVFLAPVLLVIACACIIYKFLTGRL